MNTRRTFLVSGIVSSGVIATGVIPGSAKRIAANTFSGSGGLFPENEPIPAEKVNKFVGVSHGNLEEVKSLTEEIPQLVNCLRD